MSKRIVEYFIVALPDSIVNYCLSNLANLLGVISVSYR